ncbi:uncharacterized protein Gasu_61300 [Galdieria sulphuraria]|uniref:Uncharacterized protein n=1 Tax=Galdieria sulphuraria TaxID=130081 RepID=M2X8S0_GALSU|nr:uncharacterized protein Gasu_61300 [Galdieria sulphuraria]EME26227.1 hypothetical protein Gasu_61300 [Galdieria sulphuraria]|eukprot:XP_005702747.1 hypothetical protein Gasu_61300 [Galdieria sulphuraria]
MLSTNIHTFYCIFSANGKDGQFEKSGQLGMGPRNFDLKIAIMGVEWERMDKMEMGERGEIAMGENGWVIFYEIVIVESSITCCSYTVSMLS